MIEKNFSWLTLRRFNNGLSLVVFILGIYLVLLPFLPTLQLWLDNWRDDTGGFRYQSSLASQNDVTTDNLEPIPEENTLVIPSIFIDEQVLEGENIGVIGNGGVWHRPGTSTPDKGGNSVFVGHRFSYSDPSTFYHLDKMEVGERFVLFWEGEEYIYEVFDESVVPATATEIEEDTQESIVTLYTCTPVWTAENRLVIKAKLIQGPQRNAS